jgi:hypothetical protein
MSKVTITYCGFGGFLPSNEPLGLLRVFSDGRTPESLKMGIGWVPGDHLRTDVNSGGAWEVSEAVAGRIAERYGFSLEGTRLTPRERPLM